MRKIIHLVFLLFSFGLSAQDYQPFKNDITYQYLNSTNDTITSFRFDSVAFSNSDSIFFFNRIVQDDRYNPNFMYESKLDSNNAFGWKMVKKENGDFQFITTLKDTFLIKTKEAIGARWSFYNKTNIIAEVFEKKDTIFSGIKDSLMVIRLSDGQNIKIGKNLGVLESINFNAYFLGLNKNPLFLNAVPEYQFGTFLSDPGIYYNFEVGDVFYYSIYNTVSIGAPYFGKAREEVLSKNIYGKDSTVYLMKRNSNLRYNDTLYSTPGTEYFEGTYRLVVYQNAVKDQWNRLNTYIKGDLYPSITECLKFLSNEPQILESEYMVSNRVIIYKDSYGYLLNIRSMNDFESGYEYTFRPGFGATAKYNANWSDGNRKETQKMVGYIKNGISNGYCSDSNLILSTDQAFTISNRLRIISDMENQTISIFDPGILSSNVQISNVHGEKMENYYYLGSIDSLTLNVASYPSGIYFVRVNGRQIPTRSFVKF